MQSTDKTPKGRRRRRLKWLGVGVSLGVVGLLAMPLWLPWVLVSFLENHGLTIGGYRREGMSRLILSHVGFTNAAVEVHADNLTVQLPQRWLWDRFLSSTNGGLPPQLELADWRVRVLPKTATRKAPSTNSLHGVLNRTESTWQSVRPWIRLATATNGNLILGNRDIAVSSLTFRPGLVDIQAADRMTALGAGLKLEIGGTNAVHVLAAVPKYQATSDLRLGLTNGAWVADGELVWQTNRANLHADIGRTGWWPATMSATASNVVVPAETVGLKGYQALTGGFGLTWTNGQYHFTVQGDALPTVNNPLLPDRIQIDIAGQGNLGALAIERLTITTPALQAHLSDPLAIDFSGRMLVPEAKLQVNADFTNETDLPFTGQLEGTVTARPDRNAAINAGFDVHVNRFTSRPLNVERINFNGALRWPELVVSNANFSFPDAGTFRLKGGLDLLELVSTNANWTFNGALPTNFIPAGLTIKSIDARGAASGKWPDLTQRTDVIVSQIAWRGSAAEKISATVTGPLTGTNQWHVGLNRGEINLAGDGTIDLAALKQSELKASIASLKAVLTTNSSLNLAQPVSLEASWRTNVSKEFTAQISPLKLVGPGKELELSTDLHWPDSGGLTLTATNISTADFAGLWAEQLPAVSVRNLAFTAGWDHGPLVFSSRGDLTWRQPLTGKMDGQVRARGDAAGIEFSPVIVSVDGHELVSLNGRVPLQIAPGRAPPFQWLDQGMFDAGLKSLADGPVWNRLAGRIGIALDEPRFHFAAKGRVEDFTARADFSARSVSPILLTNLPPDLSVISNLELRAEATRQSIRVTNGTFSIAGQPGRFAADLPLAADSWSDWLRALKQVDWKQATGELEIPAIDMAVVSPLLKNTLAPAGEAAVQLALARGGDLHGFVSVTNLATRALDLVGAVRDISGQIEFSDRRAAIKSFHATLGGQPLRAGGAVAWNAGGLTNADVFLRAKNLSLARSLDLFLRGDLDLRITADGNTPPTISGDVSLNNSLLFQDLTQLVSIDLNQPERRPPFFSISEPPLADWRLDVRVRGQKFLRVLSPVFKGQVSSGLQLTGTLKEPVALGEVSIDRGQMIFPFGSLEVTHGVVQLTRQNPFEPRVDFQGQGMNFGYNITVSVTGNADEPNVVFNSVPPLSTREIMLMLTAGEIPSGAYSYSNLDKASKLGYFLGKQLINQLLGLDTGEDKLLFRTGEYVTDNGQLTYRIEYKLVDWLSVFGEYTRFRDYNGGLKFNVYSR